MIDKCTVCGNNVFDFKEVLWPSLIEEWGLSKDEVDYINKQQGFVCCSCHSNLRSMTLASSIMDHYHYEGEFASFCRDSAESKTLKILEVNEAGNLTPFLQQFKDYHQCSYPEVDLQDTDFLDDEFDLVVHSDTLEHVEDPTCALRETKRILKPTGVLFYTIPIIYGRLTKQRGPDDPSYHGTGDEDWKDYLVCSEYGADFWVQLIKAGFRNIGLHTVSGCESLAIIARP